MATYSKNSIQTTTIYQASPSFTSQSSINLFQASDSTVVTKISGYAQYNVANTGGHTPVIVFTPTSNNRNVAGAYGYGYNTTTTGLAPFFTYYVSSFALTNLLASAGFGSFPNIFVTQGGSSNTFGYIHFIDLIVPPSWYCVIWNPSSASVNINYTITKLEISQV